MPAGPAAVQADTALGFGLLQVCGHHNRWVRLDGLEDPSAPSASGPLLRPYPLVGFTAMQTGVGARAAVLVSRASTAGPSAC